MRSSEKKYKDMDSWNDMNQRPLVGTIKELVEDNLAQQFRHGHDAECTRLVVVKMSEAIAKLIETLFIHGNLSLGEVKRIAVPGLEINEPLVIDRSPQP